MSKKSFIDNVRVADPCTQDWETMRGNEKIRFCEHCSKNVSNLSEMTRKEAKRIVRASNGDLCIRYVKNPNGGTPLFAEQLLQISRRSPRLAAGVISASISLANLTYAQGGSEKPANKSAIVEVDRGAMPTKADDNDDPKSQYTAEISGILVDQNGDVIPEAKITLTNDKVSETKSVTSDPDGNYRFDKLRPGNYILQAESPGFRQYNRAIQIPAREEQNEAKFDVALEIEPIEVSVDVVLEVNLETSISGGAIAVAYASALHRAVANDDIEEVKKLIARGESVDGTDENYDKITPLFIAVENGNADMAGLLLSFGAKVNARDADKQTPLMRLDEDATAELVDVLLKNGAQIDLEDSEGNTALILAAEDADAEVLEALLRGNPDVNVANDEGQTALMNAACDDDVKKVKLLLDAGANVNLKNEDDETALDQTSDDEVESLLISYGAIPKDQPAKTREEDSSDN